MRKLTEIRKAAPVGFDFTELPDPQTRYKYFVNGKGSLLGVLFEDSSSVYVEWIEENGIPVLHPPEIRYYAWPKREVTRLVSTGYWEVCGAAAVAA